MPYPRKRESIDYSSLEKMMPQGYFDKYKGKGLEQVLAEMANDPVETVSIATALLESIKTTGDPSSLKLVLAALEKQGFSGEKELPISDERYFEIIKTFSRLLPS